MRYVGLDVGFCWVCGRKAGRYACVELLVVEGREERGGVHHCPGWRVRVRVRERKALGFDMHGFSVFSAAMHRWR